MRWSRTLSSTIENRRRDTKHGSINKRRHIMLNFCQPCGIKSDFNVMAILGLILSPVDKELCTNIEKKYSNFKADIFGFFFALLQFVV